MGQRRSSYRLAAALLGLGAALTDLEFWIGFANHVDSATTANNLTIRVAILERPNATYNFHR